MKESTRVLLALVAAILLGVLIAALHNASLIRAADAIAPIGTLWINGIRMTVIPLVVSLLITGVASVSDIKSIGRLGGRTLVTFVLLLIGVAAIVIPIALAMFGLLPPHGALQLPPARSKRRMKSLQEDRRRRSRHGLSRSSQRTRSPPPRAGR
jgi:Na+/H+-dicarboxylate symporter